MTSSSASRMLQHDFICCVKNHGSNEGINELHRKVGLAKLVGIVPCCELSVFDIS